MADESFLGRWSRLKRRHGGAAPVVTADDVEAPPPPAPEAAALSHPPPAARPDGADTGDAQTEDPTKDLPPIDSLTRDSDFTAFLRAGVPEHLRRDALRKLWVSDPVLANLSGLNDYEEDYGALFKGGVPVKTIYRVGRGLLGDPGEEDAVTAEARPQQPRETAEATAPAPSESPSADPAAPETPKQGAPPAVS